MAYLQNDERAYLEEKSGLDVLRQFIPDDCYNDTLIRHVAKGASDLVSEHTRNSVRENSIDKAAAIMTYLRDNGHSFTVEPDRAAGQMRARIEGSKMQIRLMDTDENAQYVGRVHNDGLSYSYSTKNQHVTPVVDADMAVNLVKYAMGDSIKRMSPDPAVTAPDKNVGMIGSSIEQNYSKNTAITKPETFITATAGRRNFTTKAVDSATGIRTTSTGSRYFVKNDAYIYVANNRSLSNVQFRDEETALDSAETFIEDSRNSAIGNFEKELNLEALDLLAHSKSLNSFDGLPEFSSDNNFIAEMQQNYYQERLKIHSNADGSCETDAQKADAFYSHDNEFKEKIADVFGRASDKSINPVAVSTYMTSGKGSIANESDLLTALKTVNKYGSAYETYEILGDGFAEDKFKDRLISYEPSASNKDLKQGSADFENLSPFWKNISNTISSSLTETGVAIDKLNLDKNGIVHYEGTRHVGTGNISKPDNKIVGNIGQIFEPIDEPFRADGSPNAKHGLIETKYNSGNNHYIAAGYTAYVVPPTEETFGQTFEERTRLRGYEQMLTKKIKSELRNDIIGSTSLDNTVGINNVYHHIYGEKLPLDFEEQMTQEGKDNDVMNSIIKTAQQRVRYDNVYKETGMLGKDRAEKMEFKPNRGYNLYLDNVQSVMAVMNSETSKNIFDPYATGTGINQGMVRYLVDDAKVDASGKIIKGENTLTTLTNDGDFKYAKFNPPDRFIMSFMNAINQSSTARGRDTNLSGEPIDKIGVATAHMSLGGYTQDDAFVVSKTFAEQNQIRGKDGEMRALQIGDKICDHSGNKGVLSFIADTDADMSYYKPKPRHIGMSAAEVEKLTKENKTKELQRQVIEVFKDNPALDVIGAPYTAPSRFNGGMAREMIDSQEKARAMGMPTTLNIKGKEIEGGIGYAKFIVTDMPVDEKTHIYDTDGGRKASGQLVWALAEAGAKDVIDEIYKYNTGPTEKARELCITMGLDISQTGELHKGYKPHVIGIDENGNIKSEQRKTHSVREIFETNRDEKGKLHNKNFAKAFDDIMSKNGGFMKLPFPITLASGELTQEALDENGKSTGEYLMPVMSSKLRSGRETLDNKLIAHEYTNNYKTMYEQAGQYLKAEKFIADAGPDADAAFVTKHQNEMAKAIAQTQSTYGAMATELASRHFEGKHNIFKDDIMRKPLPNSATAVITPDPTLALDEVLIPATMAEALDIDKNDSEARVIMWRDPILSAGGTRYPRVSVIEDRPDYPDYDPNNPMSKLTGLAMNPSSANSYEGDFDGDSVALYKPQSAKAKANAMATLSYEAQLLNKEVGERGEHNLYFSDGLDVAAGIYADTQKGGSLASKYEEVKHLANLANSEHDVSVGKNSNNHKALSLYNDVMFETHKAAFGEDIICYKDAKSHFESLIHMTKSGAKGSPSKLIDGYAPYFGAKAEIDEDYKLVKFEDVGESYASDSDRSASLEATHAKAVLTGIAGKFSQHAAMMAKNSDEAFSNSAAANALTHPVTQSVMQLKHDTSDVIRQKQEMIRTIAPALWAGQRIQKVDGIGGKSTWEVVKEKNEKGQSEPVQMTPNEFKTVFMDFYTDKHGLSVSPPNSEHIDTMAKIMTVTENGRDIIRGYDGFSKEPVPNEKPLDRLAYEGSFQRACELADKKVNLFEGSVNSIIAPKVIRDNIKEQAKAQADASYTPKLRAIAAKDTQQVTDKVTQPSVEAVANALAYNIEIDISEMNNANVDEKIADEKARKRDILNSADKPALRSSIISKFDADKNAKYTDTEKLYLEVLAEQRKEFMSFDSNASRKDYLGKNPDAFADYIAYNNEAIAHRDFKAFDVNKISNAEKKILRDKIVQKMVENPSTTLVGKERGYMDAIKKQRAEYLSFDTVAARNEAFKSNPAKFADYSYYTHAVRELKDASKSTTQVASTQSQSNTTKALNAEARIVLATDLSNKVEVDNDNKSNQHTSDDRFSG